MDYAKDGGGQNMISVIMPVFNRVAMMRDAVDSFVSQKADCEMIVVDDGSSEDIESAIKSYNDPRIKFFKNNKNLGQAKTLNIAMRKCSGDIICQIHTDDTLCHDILEKRIKWHQETRAEVIYTDWNKLIIPGVAFYTEKAQDSAPINIIKKEHINFVTLSWKRSILDRVGYFDEDFIGWHDYEWKVRLSMECSMAYIPEPSIFYGIHGGQLSAKCRHDGTNERESKIFKDKIKARYGDLF
jgi:glycosyltransferase involved in cell wall biosynthesis